MWLRIILFVCCFTISQTFGSEPFEFERLLLKDNLAKAKKGDYVVVSCQKNLTVMAIRDRENMLLTIEEISIPEQRNRKYRWKEWIEHNAPGHQSWVIYTLNLYTGQMLQYYSFSKHQWYEIPESQNYLTKLLNLRFSEVPRESRKRIGLKLTPGEDRRPYWQPQMIVNGVKVDGVVFNAWKSRWPKDESDLSGKLIEIYLPEDNDLYPSYFPYWLQISGMVGHAKIRIIDSGTNLSSPKPSITELLRE